MSKITVWNLWTEINNALDEQNRRKLQAELYCGKLSSVCISIR